MFVFAILMIVAIAALQFAPNAQNRKNRSNVAKWRRNASKKAMPIRDGSGAVS